VEKETGSAPPARAATAKRPRRPLFDSSSEDDSAGGTVAAAKRPRIEHKSESERRVGERANEPDASDDMAAAQQRRRVRAKPSGFSGPASTSGRKEEPQQDARELAQYSLGNLRRITASRAALELFMKGEDLEEDQEALEKILPRLYIRASIKGKVALVRVVGLQAPPGGTSRRGNVNVVQVEVPGTSEQFNVTLGQIVAGEVQSDEAQHLEDLARRGILKRLTVGDVKQLATNVQGVVPRVELRTEGIRLKNLADLANTQQKWKLQRTYLAQAAEIDRKLALQRQVPDPAVEAVVDVVVADDSAAAPTKISRVPRVVNVPKQPLPEPRAASISSRKTPPAPAAGPRKLAKPAPASTVARQDVAGGGFLYRDPGGLVRGPFNLQTFRVWFSMGVMHREWPIWESGVPERNALSLSVVLKMS